jgi:A/G-specific adenine glycosylase
MAISPFSLFLSPCFFLLFLLYMFSSLIPWYQENGRDLPWRSTTDPYKIWLSEIILQQTRVEQGWDYYLRFIAAFPTVEVLAKASED